MIDSLIRFVVALTWVYAILIIVYVLLSWVQLPYNIWVGRLRVFLSDTVEPYLRVFRRAMPVFGGIDLSPMMALFALYLFQYIAIAILQGFR